MKEDFEDNPPTPATDPAPVPAQSNNNNLVIIIGITSASIIIFLLLLLFGIIPFFNNRHTMYGYYFYK